MKKSWTTIEPKDAKDIQLPHPDIQGPLTQTGEECPWPWEPQQLVGVPMGMYHCGYCGEMVMAGVPHVDYRDTTLTRVHIINIENKPLCGEAATIWRYQALTLAAAEGMAECEQVEVCPVCRDKYMNGAWEDI